MNSESIYRLSKLQLKATNGKVLIEGTPDLIHYEQVPNITSLSALSDIAHMMAVGRYRFTTNFQISRSEIDAYDIAYIFSGSGVFEGKAKNLNVSEGSTLFLHNGDYSQVCITAEEPMDLLILRHTGSLSACYYKLITKFDSHPININQKEIFTALLEKTVYDSQQSDPALLFHTMEQIFFTLYSNRTNLVTEGKAIIRPSWLIETLNYIETHLSANLTVAELAVKSHMSESHYYKLFREQMEISPYQYLIQVRLKRAKTLLITTDLPIKHISKLVGFYHVNHFVQQFKKLTHTTPSVYRQENRS